MKHPRVRCFWRCMYVSQHVCLNYEDLSKIVPITRGSVGGINNHLAFVPTQSNVKCTELLALYSKVQ